MHQKQPEILLSIGMIVKNEIRCLERCLDALSPLRTAVPCELVIADTGSTDDTREIAAKYADILFDFKWCDDFSAARNAVMNRCSGKWFFTIDADECLDPNFSELTELLTTSMSDQYDFASVVQRDYQEAFMNSSYSDFHALRLQRMSLNRRYQGTIHEAWPYHPSDSTLHLQNLILHHDGYSKQSDLFSSKQQRNLVLLEKALKKDPHDLRVVMQCLESSYLPEQTKKYSFMIAKLIPIVPRNNTWKYFGPPAICLAISKCFKHKYPEIISWTALARKTFPDSIHVAIEPSFYCTHYYMSNNEPERALQEAALYWSGVARYQKGQYNPDALRVKSLNLAELTNQQIVHYMEACSYLQLGRWEDALTALEQITLSEFLISNIPNYIHLLSELWEQSPLDLRPLLLREWQALSAAADNEDSCQKLECFINSALEELQKKPKAPSRKVSSLFAALGNSCDLGHIALTTSIIESKNAAEIEELLGTIKNWANIPAAVLGHAFKHHAKLPQSFYSVPVEIMERLSRELLQLNQNQTEALSELLQSTIDQTDSTNIEKTLWEFMLWYEIIQTDSRNLSFTQTICDAFLARAKQFLDVFYRSELYTEATICLLPIPVRFSWYCIQAKKAMAQNDSKEAIRLIKAALYTEPNAKGMVSFLLKKSEQCTSKQIPLSAPSAEILDLAKKIKSILAQFPPNDPAVLQLKASSAYQMVAHLIENEALHE